ncbi:PepSY-associated TM helix domain-containing protein [Pedobacter fastidiosus]|uniref:PepSY domain-containing protein n=1 Tax=Pedobacter fastidiosus TaxID=2765361 RepID=A0ABR7KLX1_9SPHI|nr:PepSY-associated TM helix domain-containing protein [Pedobacter fastidiosus]MBC6108969.1 PepSY domain-containing protein [Pedobacter fastidiosus]
MAGSVLLVVALTGCILSFEDELTSVFFVKEQQVVPKGDKLSVDSLLSIAKTASPKKKIFRMILPSEPYRSVKATFGSKKLGYDYLYINPYSGEILSEGKENKRFFAVVLNLHRFLLAGSVGKTITGISCAITFFMTISGLYLWWPKNRKVLKQRIMVKQNASFKRTNWDLHAVGGFYVMIFLFIITLTGLIWSYDWIETLMFKLADGKTSKPEMVMQKVDKAKKIDGLYSKIVMESNSIYLHQGDLSINFPDKKDKPILVSKENGEDVVKTVDQIYFDNRTGAVISKRPFASLTLGNQIRKLNKPIHTGSIFGWPTKLLAFIVSFLTASLPITGLLIYLGRGKKKKKISVV